MRKKFKSHTEQIYVNYKTRNDKPFFYNSYKNYDGLVLAIFSKKINKDKLSKAINFLNNLD